LRGFDRKVLVLNGRQDPMDPRTAYETAHAFSDSTLLFINQADHFPWLEQPKSFADDLQAFLNGG